MQLSCIYRTHVTHLGRTYILHTWVTHTWHTWVTHTCRTHLSHTPATYTCYTWVTQTWVTQTWHPYTVTNIFTCVPHTRHTCNAQIYVYMCHTYTFSLITYFSGSTVCHSNLLVWPCALFWLNESILTIRVKNKHSAYQHTRVLVFLVSNLWYCP